MNVIRNLLNKLPGGVFIQAAQINAWQVRITIIFTVMIAEYLKETIVQLVTFYLMPNMEIISFFKTQFLCLVKKNKNTMLSFLKIQIYVLK